ncbi:hypothetical protein PFICI_00865 [Pestalotiopsis fici W106-1]|uniref:Uncharacterized protein n=1 Tax=Pestalotiopsis fici (strain W106-1 / CGMCC3.15140) TaxID=1229662 RepID=W3XNE2_PESFW|nr:uncharacterized protein PFICI_00865 [Pestalotiopsis fici W106-1]ETS87037.1 hypothetical protein PFICI_00865 [Pestalotiopsis fici W106-1]
MIEITLTFNRSNGSSLYQHLPDDDKVYLPDSNVYVTTTSSGRPAIARKKNSDRDFDFLSEAFGIPTRASFQRGRRQSSPLQQPRSKSAYSTPTPRVIELPSDYEESPERNKVERSPGQGSSRSSSRSNSTLKSILRTPNSAAVGAESGKLRDCSPSSSRLSLGSKRRSHTFSYPPEPERTRFAEYEDEPDENDSIADSTVPLVHPNGSSYSPQAASQFHPSFTTLPNGFQQLPNQTSPMIWHNTGTGRAPVAAATAATSNLARNLNPRQTQNFGIQMPYTHAMGFQQPGNMLQMPHAPQVLMSTFAQPQPSFVPPPPPPPPFVSHPDDLVSLAQPSSLVGSDEERFRQHFETNVKSQLPKYKVTPSRNRTPKNRNDENKDKDVESAKKKKEVVKDPMDQTPPSTPIMHMHICAGCGKTRSKGYHMTHPLKKGEAPEPDYCRRCIMTADYTDSEMTDTGMGSDFLMTPALPADRKYRDHDSPTSTIISNKKGSSRKDVQKDRRKRGSLLQSVSSIISNKRQSRRANSLSTPEEGSDRASSPTGEPRVRRASSRSFKMHSTRGSHTQSPLGKLIEQQSKTSIESVALEPRGTQKCGSRQSTRDEPAKTNDRVVSDIRSEAANQSKVSCRSGATRSDVQNFSYKPSRKSSRKTSPLLPPSSSRDTLPKSQSSSSYQQPVAHNEASELGRSSERVSVRQKGTDSSQATSRRQERRPASRLDHTVSNITGSGWTQSHDQLGGFHVIEDDGLSQSRAIFDQAPNFETPESTQNLHNWPGSHAADSRASSENCASRSKGSPKRSDDGPNASTSNSNEPAQDFNAVFGHASNGENPFVLADLKPDSGRSSMQPHQSEPRSIGLPVHSDMADPSYSKPKSDDAYNMELPKSSGTPYSSHPSTTSTRKSRNKSKPEDERGADSEPELSPNQDRFDDMPSTPADAEWDGIDANPQVRRNSWGYDQGHFERQAEQMAEQMVEDELLRAGKHSGLFGLGLGFGSFNDSATSTYPTMPSYFSHLTTSRISIESCGSDEDRNDGNAHYQLSNESELEGSDTVEEKDVKQIEFSGHQSRSNSRQEPHQGGLESSRDRLSPLNHTSSYTHSNKSNTSARRRLSEQGGRGQEPLSNKSSFDYAPPSEGSSVIAHTGHSHENFAGLGNTYGSTSNESHAGTPRRRIRRFGLS